MSELTVSIKTDESTYKQKFLLYETFTASPEDPLIRECIQEAQSKLNIEPDSIEFIKVRILLTVR